MQERYITERIQHPDYKPWVKYHDIALLKLDRPLELNPRVRPACLEVNSQIPGKSAIASGFGKTSYGQYFSNIFFLFYILIFYKVNYFILIYYNITHCFIYILEGIT